MLTSKQKTEWVDALRSGKYFQGKDFLCLKGNFCCLGVLAAINYLPTNRGNLCRLDHKSINLAEDSTKFSSMGNFNECGVPPLGLFASYALANDSGEYTFSQIADHIEQHLPTKG